MYSVQLGLGLITNNPEKREDLLVKIQTYSGELVEIKDVKFSLLNGGEIHILAEPTEDEKELPTYDEVQEDISGLDWKRH